MSLKPDDEKALKALRRIVGRRMDALRDDRGLDAKQLYIEMGWEKSAYSRKHRGLTKIEDDEIVLLQRILKEPHPWPFVSVEESLLLKALGGRAAEVLEHLPEIQALLDRHKAKR